MFVNRSSKQGVLARVAFSQKVRLFEVSPRSGRETALTVAAHGPGSVWNVEFAPGQAYLVQSQMVENLPVSSWEDR